MFDAAAPEVMLRLLIVILPVLVLLVLFALLYARYPGAREAPSEETRSGGSDTGLAHGAVVSDMPTLATLEDQRSRAEAAGETQALAAIYLAIGRVRLADGQAEAGLTAIRSAAAIAARHGPALLHGEARLELAEAALKAGDPTEACEQWQMARMAFLDAGRKTDGDKVDRRMRANGCPTDWVLTDF